MPMSLREIMDVEAELRGDSAIVQCQLTPFFRCATDYYFRADCTYHAYLDQSGST